MRTFVYYWFEVLKKHLKFFLFFLQVVCFKKAHAQISLTSFSSAYTQNFNTPTATLPSGWVFTESGSNANTVFSSGNGSSNTGDTYFFGVANEWAFGGLNSNNLNPTIGASFTNNTGQAIRMFVISYTGETWRVGNAGRSDKLEFHYSTNATALNTGNWFRVVDLDYENSSFASAPQSGSMLHSRLLISTVFGLNIPNGSNFWIRWTSFDATGADDGVGVDDFYLLPIASHPDLYSRNSGSISGINIWSITRSGQPNPLPVSFEKDLNFTIQNSYTIDILGGGPYDLQHLIIESGGRIRRNSSSSGDMRYINLYGNITCNGVVGNADGSFDAIGFNVEGSVCSVGGSGQFHPGRMRKSANTPHTSSTFVFNMPAKITFNGTAGLYNNQDNARLHFIIPEGIQVDVTQSSIAIDGVDGTGSGERGGSFRVAGTLSVNGTAFLFTNNTNASYPVGFTVTGTGKVYADSVEMRNSGTAGHTFALEEGAFFSSKRNFNTSAFGISNHTFQLQPGGVFEYAGGNTIRSELPYGSLQLSGTGTRTTTGTVLHVRGNFINNLNSGNFDPHTGIVSLCGANQTIGGTATSVFHELRAANTGTKTIVSPVEIRQVLSLTGAANVHVATGGKLTLLATPSLTARIGTVPAGSTITGTVHQQRYMPGRSGANITYQLAMPFSGVSVAQVQGASSTTGIYITGNFTGKSIPPASTGITALAGANVFSFDPSENRMVAFPPVGSSNTETFVPGVGYRILDRDQASSLSPTTVVAKNLEVFGDVHCGNFDFPIIYNTSGTLIGWNFIGNPYASPISGDLMNSTYWPLTNNMNKAVYVWDGVNARFQSYINGVGTFGWNGIIPTMQGFWVRANAASPQLTVSEQAKVSTGTNAIFRQEAKPTCTIEVRAQGLLQTDQAVAYVADMVSEDVCARKLEIDAGSVQVALLYKNNRMAIAAHAGDTSFIPVTFRAPNRDMTIHLHAQNHGGIWLLKDITRDTVYPITDSLCLGIPISLTGVSLHGRFMIGYEKIPPRASDSVTDTLENPLYEYLEPELVQIDIPNNTIMQQAMVASAANTPNTPYTIFPNPARAGESIYVPLKPEVGKKLTAVLTNTLGQIILKKTLSEPFLNAPKVPGMYYLHVLDGTTMNQTYELLVLE